ncbi:leucine-rich repeat extensin-like protein 5 [Aristolochia californica]|uniref:leucine-rich repeat extensin-like protein 5 n=1 Tax=Aristolochia californica TaxID=171875 RepID=UPI0035DF8171
MGWSWKASYKTKGLHESGVLCSKRELHEVAGDMENGHGLVSPRRRSALSINLLTWLITVSLLVVDRSIADDSTGGLPSTGILCISECATCPTVCASPPPQTVSYSPNPPAEVEQHSSPPPPPPPLPPPPSPTSYNYFTTPPPPSTKSPSDNIPSVSTPTMGTRGGYSSYPYYYYYASGAPPQLSLFITSMIFLGILTSSCLVPLLGMR